MPNMKFFVHAFRPRRPDFESTQESGMEWLAAAHSVAESTARAAQRTEGEPQNSLAPSAASELFEVDSFHAQMKKFLHRFGCSPDKIGKRGHMLEDFTHLEWSRMRIFNVSKTAAGADVGARNAFFQEAALRVFDDLYESTPRHDAPADLIHVSCTGYVSPSAAQQLVVRMGWQEQTHVTHAYHMGCYAAVPALRMATGFLAAGASLGRGRSQSKGFAPRVDVVHTEMCTLHMNPLKHSPEQLVVQSLFADGFIRYGVGTEPPREPGGFEILSLREEMIPHSREAMTWDISPVGFAMTLSRDVPTLIASTLPGFLDRLFLQAPEGSSFDSDGKSKAVFAVHPGGPRIIEKVAELLGLEPWQTRFSTRVLLEQGNMSSATLPHIWHAIGNDADVASGTHVVSLAFGPGLTICGALLRKCG